MTDDEKILGDDATLGGESPDGQVDPRSLGDQPTNVAQPDPGASSLGAELTFAGDGTGEALDDGMEIVDLESRYTIDRVLGKGGMGEVLLATDTRLNRQVAIKRILHDASVGQTAVQRFLTEAQSIAALNHPNVVQIHDYGRDKEGPFLIMEYVAGKSLLERCVQGAIPLGESIDLVVQLCDGLAAAHAAGIIHRDIKPANILLTENGIPKLTDFGLAKTETADTGMTVSGAVLGTVDFMPAEQHQDAATVDERSDLWSLAATLYQMVTGESPKVIRIKKVPKQLQDVLDKALEESKQDRYQTAVELGTALRKCRTASGNTPVSELGSGECASCHTRNEAGRKFCNECAAPLRVPCFDCQTEIPAWDKVCGECGSNQQEKVTQLQEERAKQRGEVELLLQASEFDQAKQRASIYRQAHDPRVDGNNTWANELVARIDEKRDSEAQRIAEIMTEAKSHQAAFDYGSALRVLKQVPSALMDQSVAGHAQTPQELSDELTQTAREVQRFQKLVQERLVNKQYTGLLEIVEQFQVLQPNRPSLNRIHDKLAGREEKLKASSEKLAERSKDYYEQQDYDRCLRQIEKIPVRFRTQDIVTLQQTATQTRDQLQQRVEREQTPSMSASTTPSVTNHLSEPDATGSTSVHIEQGSVPTTAESVPVNIVKSGEPAMPRFGRRSRVGYVIVAGGLAVLVCAIVAALVVFNQPDDEAARLIPSNPEDVADRSNDPKGDPATNSNAQASAATESPSTPKEPAVIAAESTAGEPADQPDTEPAEIQASESKVDDKPPATVPWVDETAETPPASGESTRPTEPTTAQLDKPAIPDQSALDAATKLVADIYKADYSAAKTKEEKIALARKMLLESRAINDDLPGKHALLSVASNIAAQAGDFDTALEANDDIASTFEVDSLKMKAGVMVDVANATRAPGDNARVAQRMEPLITELIDSGRYALAASTIEVMLTSARASRNRQLIETTVDWSKEVNHIADEHARFVEASNRLKSEPMNPEANGIVGVFLCLYENSWEEGLPYLAKGAENPWQQAAAMEIADVEEGPRQVAIADQWWKIYESEEVEFRKLKLLKRAQHWYQKALSVVNGLERTMVEKRLAACKDAVSSFESTRVATGNSSVASNNKKQKPVKKNGRFTAFSQLNNEDDIRSFWILLGRNEVRGNGLRLYSGDGSIQTIKRLSGDFEVRIDCKLESYAHMWIHIAGERIDFKDGPAGRHRIHIIRKDGVLMVAKNSNKYSINLKGAFNQGQPTKLKIEFDQWDNRPSELLIFGVAIDCEQLAD